MAVTRNTIREGEKLAQPGQFAATIQGNLFPTLGAGNHSTNSNDQNIDQSMLDLPCAARTLKIREIARPAA